MNASRGGEELGRFSVECADQRARDLLVHWLREAALPWPGEPRFVVEVVAALEPEADARDRFPVAPGLTVQAGPPDDTVRVEWGHPAARAIVDSTEARATLWLTPAMLDHFEAAERSFLLVVLVFTLRRVGWYHVHCAALSDPAGHGWLLVGPSGSGKSTTTALLASRGWGVATDDIGFLIVRNDQVEVVGYRAPVALRPGGVELLRPDGGEPLPQRRKTALWPEELGGGRVARVVPRRLLFGSVAGATTASGVAPVAAVAELVKSSSWVLYEPLRAQEHLDLLARLAAQCRCHRLTVGPDLIRDPTLLEDLLHADPIPASS